MTLIATIIGLALLAVVVLSNAALFVGKRDAERDARRAWKAAGMAEQALLDVMHHPQTDSSTFTSLELALRNLRSALNERVGD